MCLYALVLPVDMLLCVHVGFLQECACVCVHVDLPCGCAALGSDSVY